MKEPWLSELYYHVGKLQSTLMTNDIQRIAENCADIANLAMMTLDVKIDLLATDKANEVSMTKESARAYLIEQGLDPDVLVAAGLAKTAELEVKRDSNEALRKGIAINNFIKAFL